MSRFLKSSHGSENEKARTGANCKDAKSLKRTTFFQRYSASCSHRQDARSDGLKAISSGNGHGDCSAASVYSSIEKACLAAAINHQFIPPCAVRPEEQRCCAKPKGVSREEIKGARFNSETRSTDADQRLSWFPGEGFGRGWVNRSKGDQSRDPYVWVAPGELAFEFGCGCFYKLGVLFAGVLARRTLLFGVHVEALDFCKLPPGETWPAWCRDQRKRTCSADTSAGPSGSFSSNSWTGGTPNVTPGLKRTSIGTEQIYLPNNMQPKHEITHPIRLRKRKPNAKNSFS